MQAIILRIATRYLCPLLLILSIAVLYRGHNLPGGGFIGGLLAAAAYLLQVLGGGWDRVREKIPATPVNMMSLGLTLAGISSLIGMLLGHTFFSGEWLPTFVLPIFGKVKLGTPLLFDIGVYLAVLGFVLQSAMAFSQEEEF